MDNEERPRRGQFWRLVGLALGGAILLSSLYAITKPAGSGSATGSMTPGGQYRSWSDALCVSTMLLGLGSGIPFLLDAGRGLMLPNRMGATKESRTKSWDEERAKREKGMRITFALALAALLAGILSVLASLW